MMRALKPLDRSENQRSDNIVKEFDEGQVLTAVAISCKEGIIMGAASADFNNVKIKRVLSRVAFLGVGDTNDYGNIYCSLAMDAKLQARVYLSPGDERIIELISDAYAKSIRERFRELYSSGYSKCEIALAQVGLTVEEDRFWGIHFSGDVTVSDDMVVIPRHHLPVLPKEGNELLGFAEMAKIIYERIQLFIQGKYNIDFSLEVAILDRSRMASGDLSKIYRKIPGSELQDWVK